MFKKNQNLKGICASKIGWNRGAKALLQLNLLETL